MNINKKRCLAGYVVTKQLVFPQQAASKGAEIPKRNDFSVD